jgi:hypothetical protein
MDTLFDGTVKPRRNPKGRPPPRMRQAQYYWVLTPYQGRTLIDGPHTTEQQANDYAFSLQDASGPSTVLPLPTSDKAVAAQMVKHKMLETSGNIGNSTQRLKHTIGGK